MTTLPTWYAIHPAGHVSRQCVAEDKAEATRKLAPGEGEYVTSAASWACRETRHRLRRPAKGWQERAVLSPAVAREAGAELARVMALGTQAGRPSLVSQREAAAAKRARALRGVEKSAAHREAIAEAMRAKWAQRRGGASG